MAFTCWYAVSGKKNSIAARGSSVTTADHRPLTPLLNWAPLGTGSSRVWGSVPGSEVLVAGGAGGGVGGAGGGGAPRGAAPRRGGGGAAGGGRRPPPGGPAPAPPPPGAPP